MVEGGADVSIVLLVYNGEEFLRELLSAVYSQRTALNFEVIAIDSGSTDSSLSIMRDFPVTIFRIPNSEFGHGKTRNLGVSLSSGEYVVFLTQDAVPANSHWLENAVTAVESVKQAAGAYSRQLPRPGCYPPERRDVEAGAPALSYLKKVDFSDPLQSKNYEANQSQYILFSNVSSCIKREVLLELPFNQDVPMVEDQDWCKRAIEAGYTVIYDATSAVVHSHNFSLKQVYRRHYDYGQSLANIAGLRISIRNVGAYTLIQGTLDCAFVWRNYSGLFFKLVWSLKSFFVRFAMRYGFYRGSRFALHARFSSTD